MVEKTLLSGAEFVQIYTALGVTATENTILGLDALGSWFSMLA